MRNSTLRLTVLLAAAPLAAQAQDVSVNYDKTYDFSKIKTFAVQIGSEGDAQDPFLAKHFVNTVTQALSAKGWTTADPAAADATVVLHGQSETRRRLEAYSTGGWRWGGGMGSAQLEDYKVGTIVVDIFETKPKALLFRGAAADELSDKAEKNEKKIDKAVGKILKDFPPGSKK
jgi:hypothetical protein